MLKNTGPPIPLEPPALESSSSFGAALDADVVDILQDVHASGSELQRHLPGSRGISHSDTRELNAEELCANLRTLLNSSLTAGSRCLYQRAWIIFSPILSLILRFWWSSFAGISYLPLLIYLSSNNISYIGSFNDYFISFSHFLRTQVVRAPWPHKIVFNEFRSY